jgi:hypothetical protein
VPTAQTVSTVCRCVPTDAHEVAVAVHAVSLGFREPLVLRGQYVRPVEPEFISSPTALGSSSP